MTLREIQALREWHIARLIELAYPREIVNELSQARERWISGVKPS